MKKIFLLLICFCFLLSTHAETITDTSYKIKGENRKKFNSQNFPILYNYLYNYAQTLYFKYDPKMFPHPGYCQGTAFYLKKDGQIVFLNPTTSKYKDIRMFRQFILDNAPAPFPKEIEDKVIPIAVDICVLKASRDNKFRIYTFDNAGFKRKTTLNISADKSIKYKNMTHKKCERMGHKWNSEGGYCITPYKNE